MSLEKVSVFLWCCNFEPILHYQLLMIYKITHVNSYLICYFWACDISYNVRVSPCTICWIKHSSRSFAWACMIGWTLLLQEKSGTWWCFLKTCLWMILIELVETAIVCCYVCISATAIGMVRNELWIKCSLQKRWLHLKNTKF